MSGNFSLRLVSWLAALGLVALPIVGVVNGWFAADRWPFRQLRIDAQFTRVNAEQVRAAVAGSLERGFFAVDLDEVRRSVEQLPWIEAAEVRKRWPDLIEVRAIERRAVAVWDDRRLVSTEAELFRVPGESAPEGLPQLAGPEGRVAEVLGFYHEALEALGGTGLQVDGVALSGRGSWMLSLASGARIVLGREAPAARLQRFIESLPRIEPMRGASFVRADLRYANGFAIEWRPPEPVLPPPYPGTSLRSAPGQGYAQYLLAPPRPSPNIGEGGSGAQAGKCQLAGFSLPAAPPPAPNPAPPSPPPESPA